MKEITIKLNKNSHPHAEMIAAKSADMSLVVLQNAVSPDYWCENVEDSIPAFRKDFKYFLCIPKHKKECLHWLNGGDCLVAYDSINDVKGLLHGSGDKTWSTERAFMNTAAKITIKPKKEKRWIGIAELRTTGLIVTSQHFATKDECVSYVNYKYLPSFVRNCQYIEIEIEAKQ